ncbi:MAG: type II toxin-antitoxin system HicB family antitoxin [Thermodesulfobacteriota bacterium]
MGRNIKIVIEKHSDGYVGYPIGMKGVVVGEGNSYEEALADVRSAIAFHVETFGPEVLDEAAAPLEVFVAETGLVG